MYVVIWMLDLQFCSCTSSPS